METTGFIGARRYREKGRDAGTLLADDGTMRTVDVQLAGAGDLEGLVGLLGDCVRQMQARGLDQWDEVYPSRATLEADIAGGTVYRATPADGSAGLLGSFTLNQHQDPEYADVPWQVTAPSVAVVHRLMVHPNAQRCGLGRFLMRFAERRAWELGFRALRLDTLLANERALALYRNLGYREPGQVRFRKGLFACFETALSDPSTY
jgi:GNAT superfamily N-acetyltransferase